MTDHERERLFNTWAPAGGVWSPWVKPVVFASLEQLPFLQEVPPPDLSAVQVGSDTVAVVDLPGAEGVAAGMAFARRGFRPVPLYNAVPGPIHTLTGTTGAYPTVVEVIQIQSALVDHAAELQLLNLPLDAPPVFLLDSRRRGEGV